MSEQGPSQVAEKSQVVDIRQLRAKRKRLGVAYVSLSDELIVGLSQVSLATLVAQERIPSPLLKIALEGQEMMGEGKGLSPDTFKRSIEFMDAICQAVIVDPPYCPIKEAGVGAVPDGALCYEDLSDDERTAIFAFVYGGLEQLETFHRERKGGVGVPSGPVIEGEAVPVGMSNGTSSHSVLGGRGDGGEVGSSSGQGASGQATSSPTEDSPAF